MVPVPVIIGILEEGTCVGEEGTCVAEEGTCVAEEVTCAAADETCVAAVDTFVADNEGWNSLMSGREAEDSWENELKD